MRQHDQDGEDDRAAFCLHRTRSSWNGRRLTTEAKISIDMPLPMPRWVMSSPIHISSAVPAARVRMISSTRGSVKSGQQDDVRHVAAEERPAAAAGRTGT